MSIALDLEYPGHDGTDLRPSNPWRIELLRQLNRSRSKLPLRGVERRNTVEMAKFSGFTSQLADGAQRVAKGWKGSAR